MSAAELADRFSRAFPRFPRSEPVADVPPPSDVAAVAPAGVCQLTEHAARGVHLVVRLNADEVVASAKLMDEQGFGLDAVTGVDLLAEEKMEVVYDYFHPVHGLRVAVRVQLPRGTPEIPTIAAVFPGANWHERETHDFFGIRFVGHPDLTPLLLPEDADNHPLRKDFAGA
jgi:NADH-quinone oxidoreductase subunit C